MVYKGCEADYDIPGCEADYDMVLDLPVLNRVYNFE